MTKLVVAGGDSIDHFFAGANEKKRKVFFPYISEMFVRLIPLKTILALWMSNTKSPRVILLLIKSIGGKQNWIHRFWYHFKNQFYLKVDIVEVYEYF